MRALFVATGLLGLNAPAAHANVLIAIDKSTQQMTVSVDSPMTQENYVKAIHVFNEKNPQANVISVRLSPRAGKAAISTRFRLADTQTIVAVAELSDGSFWSASADVIVTLAACLESLD